MPRRPLVLPLVFAVAAACGDAGGDAHRARSEGSSPLSGSITVLAAASLTEAFSGIGRRFEAAHPGAEVTFSFDASSALVRQVQAGAPADVVATADEVTMGQVVESGHVRNPVVFARNRLAIAVGKGNPQRIASLADLARPGMVVVLCSPEAPCGRSATQALDRAGVRLEARSFEPNVKGVVAKVGLGEADAGIVYLTDVGAASDKVQGVEVPSEHNVVASYLAATISSSSTPALASAFVAFVRSEEGSSVLSAVGFDPA